MFCFAEAPSRQYILTRFRGHQHRKSYIPKFLWFGTLRVGISLFMAIATESEFLMSSLALYINRLSVYEQRNYNFLLSTAAKGEHAVGYVQTVFVIYSCLYHAELKYHLAGSFPFRFSSTFEYFPWAIAAERFVHTSDAKKQRVFCIFASGKPRCTDSCVQDALSPSSAYTLR